MGVNRGENLDQTVTGFAILFLILFTIFAIFRFFGQEAGADTPTGEMRGAWFSCVGLAEDQIRAPSRPETPTDWQEDIAEEGPNRYHVSSYLYSRNFLGSEVRNRFSCVVQRLKPGHWQVDNLSVRLAP